MGGGIDGARATFGPSALAPVRVLLVGDLGGRRRVTTPRALLPREPTARGLLARRAQDRVGGLHVGPARQHAPGARLVELARHGLGPRERLLERHLALLD